LQGKVVCLPPHFADIAGVRQMMADVAPELMCWVLKLIRTGSFILPRTGLRNLDLT
jgi:hypothetical protein